MNPVIRHLMNQMDEAESVIPEHNKAIIYLDNKIYKVTVEEISCLEQGDNDPA